MIYIKYKTFLAVTKKFIALLPISVFNLKKISISYRMSFQQHYMDVLRGNTSD